MGITAGTSLNRNKAIVKALGEGIERYCAGSYIHDQLVYNSYLELGDVALHPNQYKLYLDRQFERQTFPLTKIKNDTKIYWKEAITGRTKEVKYVPANLVYCPFISNLNSVHYFESMSTGLAAHCSFEEAALNGFLEVVERNNFMFTWLTKSEPLVVEKNSLTEEHKNLIQLYERDGYQVNLSYNPGKDGIPSFIALIRGSHKNNVPLLIAAATHLDPTLAITKCLEEIALMERLCQQKLLAPSILATTADYFKVNTLLDHVMLWLNPEVWNNANFLMSGVESISLKDISNLSQNEPKEDLKFLVNVIENLGYQTLISDITPDDIRELGLFSVRAMIPAYIPLNKNYNCRPLGAQYLIDYFRSIGVHEETLEDHIYPVPHPFA